MANTIDVEAKNNLNLLYDVDKHRRRLIKGDNGISVKFVSPTIGTFEKYRYYLLRNSNTKKLQQKYIFRPDYLSYDEYGTVVLWPLILYINNISSIEEFDIEDVIIPTKNAILTICKVNELNNVPLNLDEQPIEPSKQPKLILYTDIISPNLIDQSDNINKLTKQPEDPVFYIRRRIELKEIDIFNQSVDLGFTPIIESLTLKIKDSTFTPIYNTHYTIIEKPNGQLRRLSWKSTDTPDGDGLSSTLEVGSIIEIQYVQDENA